MIHSGRTSLLPVTLYALCNRTVQYAVVETHFRLAGLFIRKACVYVLAAATLGLSVNKIHHLLSSIRRPNPPMEVRMSRIKHYVRPQRTYVRLVTTTE